MGLLFGRDRRPAVAREANLSALMQAAGIDPRSLATGQGSPASADHALRYSAVWAALRLRSDLISTLPVDVFRMVGDAQVAAPGSDLLRQPAAGMLLHEWLYATQMDLDRYGNCFGLIVRRDQAGYPLQVELWPASEVSVLMEGSLVKGYRYGTKVFAPGDVWHERQYVVAGLKVGLSPLQYAAWVVGGALAAQEFGLDWFASGAHPTGHLKNSLQTLSPEVLDAAKQRFKVATANRDIFVTGSDWEFTPVMVDANTSAFLDAQGQSAVDVARYLGVPANAIDAAVSGQSITYSNVTQNQLSLLTNYLGPAIVRRERALTAALPAPRFVKFNSDALLRMDPASRVKLTGDQIKAWVRTPDEVRGLENLPPLTPDQIELLQSMKSTATDFPDGEEAPDDDAA